MTPGRPSTYTPEIGARICEEIAKGRSLTDICKEDWAPSDVTVHKWWREKEDFARLYAQARRDQADHWADMITAIAAGNDPISLERQAIAVENARAEWLAAGKAEEAFRPEAVKRPDDWQERRLRIDTIKWLAGKQAPRIYGDFQRVELEADVKVSVGDRLDKALTRVRDRK